MNDDLNTIQELAVKRIMAFLYEGTSMSLAQGVELMYETYKEIWPYVDQKFSLFNDNVARLLLEKIKQNNIKETEKLINLDYVKIILKVAITTKDKHTIKILQYFIKKLGNCIALRLKNGENYNRAVWSEVFNYLLAKGSYYFSDDIANDENRAEYIRQFYLLAFDYCYGLICNGITDVVKSFYELLIRNATINPQQEIPSKYIIFLAIAVHSFLFYMAEEALNISNEERNFAKEIINDDSVKESLYIFMNRLNGLSELSRILNRKFAVELSTFLSSYEIVGEKVHDYLLEPVSNKFFIFFIAYISKKNPAPDTNLLDQAFDVKEITYYLDPAQKGITKKAFADFYRLIEYNPDIKIAEIAEYNRDSNFKADQLCNFITEWLKTKSLIEADIEQKAFIDGIKYDDYVGAVAEKSLKTTFAILEKMPSPPITTIPVKGEILKSRIPTNIAIYDCNKKHMAYIDNKKLLKNCVEWVSTTLLHRIIKGLSSIFPQITFYSVDEYINTLREYKIHTLIGNSSTINNINLTKSYKEMQRLTDELKLYKIKDIPTVKEAIALRDDVLGIKFEYIISNIRDLNDDEINADVKNTDGLFQYNDDIFHFNSFEEIKGYVRNKYKMLVVDAKVDLVIKDTDQKLGFILNVK